MAEIIISKMMMYMYPTKIALNIRKIQKKQIQKELIMMII